MRIGRFAALAALCAAGCGLFERAGEGPKLAEGQSPRLTVEMLDGLRLYQVREVFPEGGSVVETLALPPRGGDDLLGGRYALNDSASIIVRIYPEPRDALAALNAHLPGPITSSRLGEVTAEFPLSWWYREGPPATIIYTYGNALVTIRMSALAPKDITTRGLAAARAVGLRILRSSKGLPADTRG